MASGTRLSNAEKIRILKLTLNTRLTVKEIAETVSRSDTSVYKLLRDFRIPSRPQRRNLRVVEDALKNLIALSGIDTDTDTSNSNTDTRYSNLISKHIDKATGLHLSVYQCIDCSNTYQLSSNDENWYLTKGYHIPKRCVPCRAVNNERQQRNKDKKKESKSPAEEMVDGSDMVMEPVTTKKIENLQEIIYDLMALSDRLSAFVLDREAVTDGGDSEPDIS